ncbi:hypothetical protein BFP72_09800 [Reichenbachiella sp. 5M10]|uniref:glycosyltransferase family 4 protein n=1 Tax=Reichenbachiella sp. 5M10 TaxID=1889772 RepID=UPI000C15BC43|nr:glycosyltransferase family 4 protein [Reichenbachiella sp. 5M10]PIB35664.1 hypothetical protein BFP72_09800 [Reichenbachiella sp. 5M10]
MKNTRVLIISYYWPPSGGAGVQRWLKLTKYLGQNGIEPHVLTVHEDSASYMQWDESLVEDVSAVVQVTKTKSFEPINYYSKLVGKKNVPTAGFANVDSTKLSQRAVNFLRSNLFIPDPRRGWNNYAYARAKEIIEREGIELVITTSPPHSTQLIGLRLQKNLNVKWMADFRDPWTNIYYYELFGHSWLSKRIDQSMERRVLQSADQIVTVSEGFKRSFGQLVSGVEHKIKVITNGFDGEDFEHLQKRTNSDFTISYTGTMSDQYDLSSFIRAMKKVQQYGEGVSVKLQMVGNLSVAIQEEILAQNIPLEYIRMVPHSEVLQYQKNADLLLLIIPDTSDANGIIPGKIFEYLASGNPIFCIGPPESDAAGIIDRCAVGQTMDRSNEQAMVRFLQEEIDRFKTKGPISSRVEEINSYSRESQAATMAEVIRSLLERNNQKEGY